MQTADGSESGQPRRAWLWKILWVFIAALSYAALRYHVFGSIPWSELPLFTGNKAVSVVALIAVATAYTARAASSRLRWGMVGFALTVLHVLMSLVMLGPHAYPKLYAAAGLTPYGQLGMFTGGLAMAAVCVPAAATVSRIRQALGAARWVIWQRMGYVALGLTALHVLAIGAKAWFEPRTWPGWMPPITLGSFLIALAPLLLRLLRRYRTTGR